MENLTLKEKVGIDVSVFARTLGQTHNSYKFFWLYSLLEVLKKRKYKTDSPIAYREIFYLMLRFAKAPCQRFNLSLGEKDTLCEHVRKMEESGDNIKTLWDFDDISDLDNRAFIEACRRLSNYVPTRWIHPFVSEHTAEVRAGRNERIITAKIIQVAAMEFKGKNPPPYRICGSPPGNEIVIHPKWAEYFEENDDIVRGWCLWYFAQYLQKRNPNIPGILNKVMADENAARRLQKQRKFWREVIDKGGEIPCLYSGKHLNSKIFDLDHYVPWSFVGHDNLWNLIPADGNANSSKGDRLPNNKRYMDGLVKAHCRALSVRTECFPKKYIKLVESYCADLKVSVDDLTNEERMRQAYKMFIPPLIDLATANNFKGGWVYKSPTPLYDIKT